MRQEFERNRFINKLSVVDVLLLKSNADYQVSGFIGLGSKRQILRCNRGGGAVRNVLG